jgi:hypothetical protein
MWRALPNHHGPVSEKKVFDGQAQSQGFPATLGFSAAFLMRFKTLLEAGTGAILHPMISRGRSIQAEIREEAGAQDGASPERGDLGR